MRAKSVISTLDATSGALILVFGLFVFSIQDNIIKYFSDSYSVLQIVFLRSLIAIGILLALFHFSRDKIPLVTRRPILMLSRGLLGFASYTCYYLAVASMPLAEVVESLADLAAIGKQEGWGSWKIATDQPKSPSLRISSLCL